MRVLRHNLSSDGYNLPWVRTDIVWTVETSRSVTRWLEDLACIGIGALHRLHKPITLAPRFGPFCICSIWVKIQECRSRIVTEEVLDGLWHNN